MRILYVCSNGPFGPPSGVQQRALHVTRALRELGDLSVVIASELARSPSELQRTREELTLEHVFRLSTAKPMRGVERLRHELDPGFLRTHEQVATEHDAALLSRSIERTDLVWVHTLRMANVFGRSVWPRSVIDLDDLPSQFHLREARWAARAPQRINALRKALLWKRREGRLLQRFTVATVCSAEDRRTLGEAPRVLVVPNGWTGTLVDWRRTPAVPPRIGMIGEFTYPPNIDGARWLIDHVWPRVRERVAGAELRLVGHGSERLQPATNAGVCALGFVEDPNAELSSWSAMAVPLRMGAGTRVKVAEAFARGLPVVATRLGAFGYQARHERDLLLADAPQAFADAAIALLTRPELGAQLAENARALFEREHSQQAITRAVTQAVEACRA